jgi:hypothetical protein
MTDETLIPLSDDEVRFAIRMAIGRDIHGRMRHPAKGERPWDVTAQMIVDHFRLSRIRVLRVPPEPIRPNPEGWKQRGGGLG